MIRLWDAAVRFRAAGGKARCEKVDIDGGFDVKMVIAVIQPTKLEAVREALQKIEVTRLTICDAQALGNWPTQPDPHGREVYADPFAPALLRKIALQVIVNDDFLDRTVATISHVARTGPEGSAGDGKIFVVPAEEAIQVNSGARGPGAV